MSPSPHKSDRSFGLDILRALAILLVLAAHTWPSPVANNWANAAGVFGVELFFVLSGYLIGGILIRQSDAQRLHTWQDLVAFWRRRWFRTLPNYYLFLGLHLAWRAWILGFPDVISTQWEYLVFAQNLRCGPSFFFPETWSLAIEEWFYLLFALAIWAGLRLIRSPGRAWVFVIGTFLVVPCLLRVWYVMQMASNTNVLASGAPAWRQGWDMTIRRTVMLRLDVVMYGVVAALLAARRRDCWQRVANLWPVALVMVGVGVCSLAFNAPLDRGNAVGGLLLWPCMGTGCALLLPCFCSVNGWEGWLGDAVRCVARLSYALYLCHGLVLLVLWKYCRVHSIFPLVKQTWPWCLTAWVLAFSVAWIVNRWYEKPIMDMRDPMIRPTSHGAARPREVQLW